MEELIFKLFFMPINDEEKNPLLPQMVAEFEKYNEAQRMLIDKIASRLHVLLNKKTSPPNVEKETTAEQKPDFVRALQYQLKRLTEQNNALSALETHLAELI